MPSALAAISSHDRTWAWKAVLRFIASLFDLAGIGLTAWALSNLARSRETEPSDSGYGYDGPSSYYYSSIGISTIPWNIISFSLSFIWCLTNPLVLLIRKRWPHPGSNVACDLILWLAFLTTALFSTGGAVSALTSYYLYDDSSSSSSYYYQSYYHYPNGTSYEITPDHPAPPCPGFESCAQRDALRSWVHRRGVVIAAASALAWLLLLMHFALFVSACRYTHQKRKERYGVTNEKLRVEAGRIEERVIRRLKEEGRLIPATTRGEEGVVGEGSGDVADATMPPQTFPERRRGEVTLEDEIGHAH